jgi:serine/threonine protein kinase
VRADGGANRGQRTSPRFALILFVLLLLLSGCERSEGQVLRRWTFAYANRTLPIRIPVHLNAELPKQVGEYRIFTDVVLDEGLQGRDVDLLIPYLPAKVSLRVDGRDVLPVARTDTEETYRHVGPHRWTIPRSRGPGSARTIELTVSYVWTHSAWLDVAPRLVPSGTSTGATQRNRILNDRGGWFGLVGLSQMGLTFLAVYYWDRRQRAYLFFAIQALTAAYYPMYVLGLTTWLGPALENAFLAQSLSIATVISVYYTSEYFERGRPSRLWLLLLGVSFLGPIPAIFPAFVDTTYATPGVAACVGATIVYQIVVGSRLVSTYADRRTGIFFLCCWLALGGSAWMDVWSWIGGGELLAGGRPACIGLGTFGIFQCMLLSRSHFRSLEQADQLNGTLRGRLGDLEQRQAEIQALNEELRQQVGRRSAHILAALTNVEGPSAATHFEPGDVIEDRYRVIGALGSGGMGTVYEVERLHDQRRLALKVTLESRGLALARLAREAQIATRVRHPNLVAVVDADVAKAGYVYLVMELVEGCSLSECEGQRDPRWCLKVLVQILEGLSALHGQGITHRDLKPGNVLLSGDLQTEPLVRITDFGISRGPAEPEETPPALVRVQKGPEPATVRVSSKPPFHGDATDSDLLVERGHAAAIPVSSTPQLTRTGAISGTPSYVAPELARSSGQMTPAVDVFSFGVVAYRLLTGKQPHAEAPLLARLDGREPLPHLPLVVPNLPKRTARLLDACLSFFPEGRPGTRELLRVLWEELEDTKPPLRSAEGE